VQNMAARIGVCHLNEQRLQILDFFLSSSSSDDDDYLLSDERRIIQKIQNFLKIVHSFFDNEVSFYFRLYNTLFMQVTRANVYIGDSSLNVIFEFLGKQGLEL